MDRLQWYKDLEESNLQGEEDEEHRERWAMNAEDERERHLNPPGLESEEEEKEEEQQPLCKKLKQ